MFQEKLLKWYHDTKRPLPWRENHNPYFIWLSEIMLQQTQVVTVIEYFKRFVEKFPTLEALAQGQEDEVLKLWEGLGYYSRARRLISCAKEVVDKYDGEFPRNYEALMKLPGIGPYTAGAISSIAFNEKVPAVDGNVMRVYARLFYMKNDLSNSKTIKVFQEKVKETLPEDCRHFNQALMELGALICSPKKPKCDQCPIQEDCLAFDEKVELELPVKTKKIKKKTIKMAVCQVVCKDYWMIEKRLNQGLLGGLWGFPSYPYETCPEEALAIGLKEDFDLRVETIEIIKTSKHVFTHLIWEMTFYKVGVSTQVLTELPENKWIVKESIEAYPLPTAFRKLLK